MTDKFDNMPPDIVRFLLVALDHGKTDSERGIAIRKFAQYLTGVGADGYELVERITTPPISEEDIKLVFDKGRETERSIIEQQQHRPPPIPATTSSFFSAPGPANASRVYGFGDTDRISGRDIFNGYAWADIACHCDQNSHRIPDQHHGFLEGMADQLSSSYGTISGKQAKYLGNLFRRHLGRRI